MWEEGKTLHLADEAITDSSSVESEIARYVHVGLLCVQECADDRPTMPEIVLMLSSDATNLPEPKKPVICRKIINEFRITYDSALCLYQFNSINDSIATSIEGR